MKYKQLVLFAGIMFMLLPKILPAQSGMNASDILGEWKANPGYVITIKGSEGVVTAMPDNFPKHVMGGVLYRDISYSGNGRWNAVAWNYEQNDKVWKNRGACVLAVSADKKTLTASEKDYQGKPVSKNFTRLSFGEQTITNNTNNQSTDTLRTESSGIDIMLIRRAAGAESTIFARFKNPYRDRKAYVVLRAEGRAPQLYTVGPLEQLQFPYRTQQLDIFIRVELADYQEKSETIIDKIKGAIRVQADGGLRTLVGVGARG